MRYRNVAAAADWLCAAFGFEKHRIVTMEGGEVAVAQLSIGSNMIMLLPVGGSELDQLMKQPDEIGGAETQSCYVVVDDIDVHHSKAKAAGAQFVLDLKEYDNGGRGFSCRDPEGHIWSFGTYDPAENEAVGTSPAVVREPAGRGARIGAAMIAGMVAIAVLFGGGGWVLATLQQATVQPGTPQQALPSAEIVRLKQEAAAAQQRAQQALEQAARETAGRSRERSEREAAERAAKQAADQLASGRGAKEAAERIVKQMEAQLAEERRAKEVAERAAKQAADQLATGEKEALDRAARQVEAQLTEERRAREAAERAAKQAAEQLATGAKDAVERAAKQVEAQLIEERRAREAAERAAKSANDQIARERTAKQAAQNATSVVQKELSIARAARQAAEQAAKEAAEQLALERAAREAAERAVKGSATKPGQSQNEKGIPLPPANSELAPKKMSKKSGQASTTEPMPALLP